MLYKLLARFERYVYDLSVLRVIKLSGVHAMRIFGYRDIVPFDRFHAIFLMLL